MRLHRAAVLIAACVATCTGAAAQEFQLEDVPAAASVPIAQIKPRTIIFADQRNDKLADSRPDSFLSTIGPAHVRFSGASSRSSRASLSPRSTNKRS